MVILRIKVKPNSKIDNLTLEKDYLVAKIKGRAKGGEANKYLINFLSKELGISKSLITIDPKSLKSKYKKILVKIDNEEELWKKLEDKSESEALI